MTYTSWSGICSVTWSNAISNICHHCKCPATWKLEQCIQNKPDSLAQCSCAFADDEEEKEQLRHRNYLLIAHIFSLLLWENKERIQICDYATLEKYTMDKQIMVSFHNEHKYTERHYHSDKRYFKHLAPSADLKNKFPRNILNNSCSYI